MPFQIIRHNENLRKEEKTSEIFGQGGSIKVCMVYPNTYHTGMSNLGFQTIYRLTASFPDYYCDRAFLPDTQILNLYRKSHRTLMGFHSEKPLQEFDIINFSVSFEMDYLNILKILDLAGIPKRAAERDEKSPLIIAGGAAISINPEILADFIDLFVIGEGEEPLPALMNLIRENSEKPRRQILSLAAKIPGIYVPSLYKIQYKKEGFIEKITSEESAVTPVKRITCLEALKPARSLFVSPNTEFSNMFLVEISRGCPFSCAFCCLSLHNKPYRAGDLEDIISALKEGLSLTDKIGLLGAAVGSHPHLSEILDEIGKEGGQVNFSSLRADVLKPEMIKKLHALGQNLITLAPETGSENLRKRINKSMKNRDVIKTAKEALRAGFRQIRLYFMVGIPDETDDDILDAVNLIEEVEESARETGAKIIISVNQLVPKPGTPLETSPLEEISIVENRIKMMKDPFLKRSPVEFKIESLREILLQAFLCRANRNWGKYLLQIYRKSPNSAANFINSLRKKEPSVENLLYNPIPPGETPPWHVIA